MKASILFDSKTGNTEKAGEWISLGMKEAGVEAKCFNISAVDKEWVKDSDCIILGSPTYMADVSADMKKFLEGFGAYGVAGKLGGAYATAQYDWGGGVIAIETILRHMLVAGMMVYSSGGTESPVIHLGPVSVNGNHEDLFVQYGRRMAKQCLKVNG